MARKKCRCLNILRCEHWAPSLFFPRFGSQRGKSPLRLAVEHAAARPWAGTGALWALLEYGADPNAASPSSFVSLRQDEEGGMRSAGTSTLLDTAMFWSGPQSQPDGEGRLCAAGLLIAYGACAISSSPLLPASSPMPCVP